MHYVIVLQIIRISKSDDCFVDSDICTAFLKVKLQLDVMPVQLW